MSNVDIVLEIARALLGGLIFLYLMRHNENELIRKQKGWRLLLLGFGLIFFGMLIDITDNFEALNKFILIGDTDTQAFLEKVVGYLFGFFFLMIGFNNFIPTIIENESLRNTLTDLNEVLADKVKNEQKRVERALELIQLKTRFVSSAAHELRTPLTSMKGYLEMALDEELSPRVREYLEVAARNTDRLEALTDDLLDQQRLEGGKMVLTKVSVVLGTLISEVVEEMFGGPAVQKHRISLSLPDEPVSVMGDRLRLTQLFVNLLSNASKFSLEDSMILVKVEKQDSLVLVSVEDDGIGLSEEDIGMLFQPFPDIDRPVVTKQSVGLGLSISKGIVKLHGGEIWAESEGIGKGSRLIFTLPMDNE